MKGKAKKPLTMDEHKEIGRRLREMRKELVSMEVQIYNHLPQTELWRRGHDTRLLWPL